MAGCLTALRFWRQKKRVVHPASTREKFPPSRPEPVDLYDPKKPHQDFAASTGASYHDDVNHGTYSTHSTSGVSRQLSGATLNEEEANELEAKARRRQAEQEEQDRLDFFQMM